MAERVELPQVEQQCGNCRFWWDNSKDGMGSCVRHAPMPHVAFRSEFEKAGQNDLVVGWPETACYEWCGEWQARKPKPGEPIAEYVPPG